MGKRIRIWLAFGLSAIISVVIVAHSSTYLLRFFPEDSFLMILALILIEIGFVALPYVAVWNTLKKPLDLGFVQVKWDFVLVAILFSLSVVPATLQTVDGFKGDVEANIIEVPVAPQPSTLKNVYLTQITDIQKQIDSNEKAIAAYLRPENNYITRSQKVADKNVLLAGKKSSLLREVSKIEQEDLSRTRDYDKDLRSYTEKTRRADFNSFFDWLKITWALFLVSVLQIVNGRFVFHGTSIMNQKSGPGRKDSNLINKHELLSSSDLIQKVKVTGIGIQTVDRFIQAFDIFDEPTLLEFVEDEDQLRRIDKLFPKDTARRLKRFCKVIQRKLITDETEEK